MNLVSLLASSIPSVICMVIGVALVILEMMMPGFGVPGTVGILLTVAGIWSTGGTVVQMLALAGIVVVILLIALPFCLRVIAKGKFARSRMVLRNVSLTQDKGEQAEQALVGKTGVAETMLRPAGIAVIEGEKRSVVTDGEFVEQGKAVKVVKCEGNRIVVAEDK